MINIFVCLTFVFEGPLLQSRVLITQPLYQIFILVQADGRETISSVWRLKRHLNREMLDFDWAGTFELLFTL